jgi:hypothetical protein
VLLDIILVAFVLTGILAVVLTGLDLMNDMLRSRKYRIANRVDSEQRRLQKSIQALEHTEMPPPYEHDNCAMCREFHQVKSLEQPDLWEEYEVQSMDGVTLFKFAERRYKDSVVGQPLDVRPAEPETIRR